MTADDLTPDQRLEVQDHYLNADAKRRDFRDSGRPERRVSMSSERKLPHKKVARHVQPWRVHALPVMHRPPWPVSYPKTSRTMPNGDRIPVARPGQGNRGNRNRRGKDEGLGGAHLATLPRRSGDEAVNKGGDHLEPPQQLGVFVRLNPTR